MTQQTAPEKNSGERQGAFSLLGTASTMGLHMVSGPVVGGGLGWLLDEWLGSWPIASSIGFFLGIVAGFRNVWADARYLERSNAANDAADAEKVDGEKTNDMKRMSTASASRAGALVPDGNKGDKPSPEAARPMLSPDSPAGQSVLDDSDEDFLTASILAGTAVSGEKGLDEVDETEEAIRRVLLEGQVAGKPEKAMGEAAGKPSGAVE